MADYSQVETKITATKWAPETIQTLVSALPRLGRWSLSFSSHLASRYLSANEADEYVDIIVNEPNWYLSIENNSSKEITSIVKSALKSDDLLIKRAVLANILDIRDNRSVNSALTRDLSKLFDELQIQLLPEVPPSQVAEMLSTRISNIVLDTDLVLEVKRYCYYKDAIGQDEPEVLQFKQALENNVQLIGADAISVRDWINDFLQTASSSTNRSTYNVAFYMINSPKAQKLGKLEKQVLSEILQLYNWLLQPVTSEKEIEEYEETRDEHLMESVQAEVEPQPVVAQEQVSVASKMQPPLEYMPAPEIPPAQTTPLAPEAIDRAPQAAPEPEPQPVPEPTEEQRRMLEQIRNSQQKGEYNGGTVASSDLSAEDAAKLHDLINKNSIAAGKRGVTLDPTNIKIDEEKKRISEEREKQFDDIQRKLAELRKRNQNNG